MNLHALYIKFILKYQFCKNSRNKTITLKEVFQLKTTLGYFKYLITEHCKPAYKTQIICSYFCECSKLGTKKLNMCDLSHYSGPS